MTRVIHIHEREREPPVIDGRVPPHDLDAEAAVLSAVLIDGAEVLSQLRDVIAAESFYSEANRLIFEACLSVCATGKIDAVTVAGELRERGQIQRVQASYLGQIIDASPAVANVREHALIVQRLYLRRRLIASCQRLAAEGYGDVGDDQEFLQGAARDLHALVGRGASLERDSVELSRAVTQATAEVRDRIDGSGMLGTPTGLSELDEATAGIHAGDLVVLTAKSGGGKTALAGCVTVNVAERWVRDQGGGGGGVGVFSLEMPYTQLAMRMACAKGRVNFHALRLGRATEDDYARLVSGAERVRALPIRIEDGRRVKWSKLEAGAKRMRDHFERAGVPLRLLVIDYLQKVVGLDEVPRGSTRERELHRVAELCVELAEGLDCCVLALAQLNDDGEVRESRAIVHEAHAWWDLKIEAKERPGARAAKIEIRKQRHAPFPATAPCWFHPALTWFSDEEVLP